MKTMAGYHARRRCEKIKRQFIPGNAPLSALESNYIGALGELGVKYFLTREMKLDDNYDLQQVDHGDIQINGLIYDIKTEAIPAASFKNLFYGKILDYERYGCRVWTARHSQHLQKYTGGVIFVAAPIPDDSKTDREHDQLRKRIVDFAEHLLLIGFAEQKAFLNREVSWYSPSHPASGSRFKYNSPNYRFHHSELQSIKLLTGNEKD